jgi:hypothetical protein
MTSFEHSFGAAKNGNLVNLAKVAGLDLAKPWWDQNIMRETSIMNKIYYATGDITVVSNDGTFIMLYNKNLHQAHGLPDMYEIVRKGEWTHDKFMELCKGITADLDGDGKITQDDKIGFAGSGNYVRGFFFSTGSRILRKTADDMPDFAFDAENAVNNLEKIFELVNSPDDIALLADRVPGGWQAMDLMFEEDRALFWSETMIHISLLRQMETPFGVLPLPKANKEQAEYYTYVHSYGSAAVSIPIGASGEEQRRTGVIIEAMAYKGFEHLRPAHFDVSLKTKFVRDEDSARMLDLILAGRSADLGYVGNLGGLFEALMADVLGRKNTFASTIEKQLPKLVIDIEKLIEIYKELP